MKNKEYIQGLALRLIKAYLMFNHTATSRQLSLYLENDFNLGKSYSSMGISKLIEYGLSDFNHSHWFNVEAIENTSPKQWRLTK